MTMTMSRTGEAPPYEGFFPDWVDWLIAFTIAYILIEHAGSIIGLLGDSTSGLTKLVMLLIPAA